MKIGFIKDVDGYRAPVHPESIDKYTSDIHLEKGLFDYLNYSEPKNVKTISKLKELDNVACGENIEDKVVKNLKEGDGLIGICDCDKINESKK